MNETAQNSAAQAGDRCTRCLQPVPARTPRCPNCGQPIVRGGRSLTLLIGAGGVGALVFLVLLMWLVVRNEDLQKAPLPIDEQTEAKQPPIQPEGSSGSSQEAPKDEKPEKPPPLSQ
jgi:hypothetical protein